MCTEIFVTDTVHIIWLIWTKNTGLIFALNIQGTTNVKCIQVSKFDDTWKEYFDFFAYYLFLIIKASNIRHQFTNTIIKVSLWDFLPLMSIATFYYVKMRANAWNGDLVFSFKEKRVVV